MNASLKNVSGLMKLIDAERERQQLSINLIASENYPDAETRLPLASIAGTKYAEGYPGRRYYAGCAVVDEIESLAQQTLLDLFVPQDQQHLYHVNVQPHAGSSANLAVYNAILKPGQAILSMSLAHGGHLTHGHAINLSGKTYTIISYGVDHATGLIDYDAVAHLARQHKPTLIIAGATAYSRAINFERFAAIATEVGALLLADIAHIAGLIAGGQHPTPVGHADIITSTTHKTLRGTRGAFILCKKEFGTKIDLSIMPGTQGGPFMHAIASRAVAFIKAQDESFKEYARLVCTTARALAEAMANLGFHIVSGGTDTHLFLVDLSKTPGLENLTGKEAEQILEKAGIIVNRNAVPGDARPPLITSGIRIGVAGMVTRGMNETHTHELARLINGFLRQTTDETITHLARHFKLPE